MNKYALYAIFTVILVGSVFLVFKNRQAEPINTEEIQLFNDHDENLPKPTFVSGIYTNPLFGFTLNAPLTLKITDFDEGAGHNILMNGNISGVGNFSMQIYISPVDEDTTISIAKIKKDIPDLKMIEPIEIKTGGSPTVAFFSNENDGKYRQIWFIHGSYLYQIQSKAEHDNITGKIMESWKWTQ